jgi:hypothetical protein
MELLLDEEHVLSCQTSVTAQKRLNFLSDRWITSQFLQEFLEAFFVVVAKDSLFFEANV